VLVLCWCCVGVVLVLCWCCVGVVLCCLVLISSQTRHHHHYHHHHHCHPSAAAAAVDPGRRRRLYSGWTFSCGRARRSIARPPRPCFGVHRSHKSTTVPTYRAANTADDRKPRTLAPTPEDCPRGRRSRRVDTTVSRARGTADIADYTGTRPARPACRGCRRVSIRAPSRPHKRSQSSIPFAPRVRAVSRPSHSKASFLFFSGPFPIDGGSERKK